MNLSSMLLDLYRRLRYLSTPPAETTVRLTSYINDVHQDLCTIPGVNRLRDDILPITAFANRSRSGLPPMVARVNGITDRVNNVKLRQTPLSELRALDPAQAFISGFPVRYAVVGGQAVQIQPAITGSGLWAASSSSSDTTQHAFVETIRLGGYPNTFISNGTLLTGTSRVALGALTDHIEVTRFYVDAAGVGYVSLYDAVTAGNELARLPVGQLWSRYQALEWWPIQTQDTVEYLDFTRTIFDLVNPTDEPLIPSDFHAVICDGVMEKEYVRLDDNRAAISRADYQQGIADMTSWVMNDPDRIASLRPTPTRWNRLGGNYPNERTIW